MREIDFRPFIIFMCMFIPASALAIYITLKLLSLLPLGDYRAITTVCFSIIMIYALNILAYRLFLWKRPMPAGEYAEGSPEEFTYFVYVLFYLFIFNPLLPALLVPLPFMRSIYIALGARLGKNTYSAGTIFDPPFVQIGNNTIIGFDAVICPHAIEGARVSFAKITLGNNVTIGMKSVIMQGVTIEDGAIVAAGAVVKKDTHIKAGELWGGTPAKLLKANYGAQ